MIITVQEVDDFQREVETYEHETKVLRILIGESAKMTGKRPEEMQALLKDCTLEELLAAQKVNRTSSGMDKIEVHLYRNPHLFIPLGYDELRIEPGHGVAFLQEIDKAVDKRFGARPDGYRIRPERKALWEYRFGLRCRELNSGAWHTYHGFNWALGSVRFSSGGGEDRSLSLREMLDACRLSVSSPDHPAVLVLPNLWRAPESESRIELVECSRQMILELSRQARGLDSLSWQQFEDVVAELLRSRGMQVHVTPRSRDGGRDILARGELLPGEPATLAVEVKHKGVVGIDEVRSRLYANRHFPAVLFATSGRFTAGVIKEKKQPDNFLRMLLKDGSSIRSWIDDYGVSRRCG